MKCATELFSLLYYSGNLIFTTVFMLELHKVPHYHYVKAFIIILENHNAHYYMTLLYARFIFILYISDEVIIMSVNIEGYRNVFYK